MSLDLQFREQFYELVNDETGMIGFLANRSKHLYLAEVKCGACEKGQRKCLYTCDKRGKFSKTCIRCPNKTCDRSSQWSKNFFKREAEPGCKRCVAAGEACWINMSQGPVPQWSRSCTTCNSAKQCGLPPQGTFDDPVYYFLQRNSTMKLYRDRKVEDVYYADCTGMKEDVPAGSSGDTSSRLSDADSQAATSLRTRSLSTGPKDTGPLVPPGQMLELGHYSLLGLQPPGSPEEAALSGAETERRFDNSSIIDACSPLTSQVAIAPYAWNNSGGQSYQLDAGMIGNFTPSHFSRPQGDLNPDDYDNMAIDMGMTPPNVILPHEFTVYNTSQTSAHFNPLGYTFNTASAWEQPSRFTALPDGYTMAATSCSQIGLSQADSETAEGAPHERGMWPNRYY